MSNDYRNRDGVRDFESKSKKSWSKTNAGQKKFIDGEVNASFRPANYYCIAIGELVRK